jgi:threonine synthase
MCGINVEADRLWNLCPKCQKPLLARYDLRAARKALDRDRLMEREPNMWRYWELMPVRDPKNILCLGEGFTPLHHALRLGRELNFAGLYIKDEGLNPTCSFKARGLSAAVSRAVELGVTAASIPSAGNAGNALAAYAALAGIKAYIFMPVDVPKPFINECKVLGADVTLINGLITDCGKAAAEGVKKYNRFDFSTLKEPYRLEGKKTMGYELAEQMHWTLPDVVIYPTGGGTGLVGMWKAFAEMEELGWIGPQRPRMVVVQAEGCAPMVKAFQEGQEFAPPWQGAKTIADGMRVPAAVGDFLIIRAVKESRGTALSVSDKEILEAAGQIGRSQGIFVAPEGAATLCAFLKLRQSGWIQDHETVVLFNTGSGHKYSHLWD